MDYTKRMTHLLHVNLNGISNILDHRGILRLEAGLVSDLAGNYAPEQELGVDDGNTAEGRARRGLPEIVVDDVELQGVVGDRHFKQRAGLLLLDGIGVADEGREMNVDRVGACVNEGDELRLFHIFVDVSIAGHADEEGWLIDDKVVGQDGLGLVVLDNLSAGVDQGGWEVLEVL